MGTYTLYATSVQLFCSKATSAGSTEEHLLHRSETVPQMLDGFQRIGIKISFS
jgi:hypothetical protein